MAFPSQRSSRTTCVRLSLLVPQSPLHVPFSGCPNCADAGSAHAETSNSAANLRRSDIDAPFRFRTGNCRSVGMGPSLPVGCAEKLEGTMRLSAPFWLATAGLVFGLSLAAHLTAQSQAPAAARRKAGESFKNVTTSTLKELSVDDFVASMGVITADLGLDCADCHPNAGTDRANFAVDNARKNTTRRMVEMVATI